MKYDIRLSGVPVERNSEGGGIQVSLLAGQTAVITGGAQGLGLAIAQRFVAEGARVVLGDLNLEETQVAAKQLGGNDVAVAVRCDVTQAADVEALIQTAVERFGGLDIMVNNAGITRDATMRKMTEEQFDQVIDVHLKGTWNGIRLAAAIMRENKRGAIMNMSSVSGKVGMVGQTNYSAAKAGIVGMTKAAAKELAYLGVRVNAIAPGLIRSAMTEAMPQRIWDAEGRRDPDGPRRRAQRSRQRRFVLGLRSVLVHDRHRHGSHRRPAHLRWVTMREPSSVNPYGRRSAATAECSSR